MQLFLWCFFQLNLTTKTTGRPLVGRGRPLLEWHHPIFFLKLNFFIIAKTVYYTNPMPLPCTHAHTREVVGERKEHRLQQARLGCRPWPAPGASPPTFPHFLPFPLFQTHLALPVPAKHTHTSHTHTLYAPLSRMKRGSDMITNGVVTYACQGEEAKTSNRRKKPPTKAPVTPAAKAAATPRGGGGGGRASSNLSSLAIALSLCDSLRDAAYQVCDVSKQPRVLTQAGCAATHTRHCTCAH
jgi:hypothetical protein